MKTETPIMALPKAFSIFKPYKNYQKQFEVPNKTWQDPFYFIAFGFGSGASPIAPGTMGTLMAIPFYLMMKPLSDTTYFVLVVVLFVLAVLISEKVSREIEVHDHPGMCLDEFIGYFITMFHAPSGWIWILLGFIFFRFFDIWKPWPIYILDQKIHGGLGMIVDDAVAGLFSLILIQIISFVLI